MLTAEELDACTHVTNPTVSHVIQYKNPQRLSNRKAGAHGIDFDEASQTWMGNKVRKGAMIYYRCHAIQKNGVQCALAQHTGGVCKRHKRSARILRLSANDHMRMVQRADTCHLP